MKTITYTTTYHLKWQIKGIDHFVATKEGKLFNAKTGREIKETVNGGYTKGYWIGRKFMPTNKMNDIIEKIPLWDYPRVTT